MGERKEGRKGKVFFDSAETTERQQRTKTKKKKKARTEVLEEHAELSLVGGACGVPPEGTLVPVAVPDCWCVVVVVVVVVVVLVVVSE
jgi:hypothetical protein